MKKHRLYKWISRMAMLSGIPALTMVFGCENEKLYGPPVEVLYGPPSDYMIMGEVHDKENDRPLPAVLIQDENGDTMASTSENGEFLLMTNTCTDLVFSKDGYIAKDTTLCPSEGNLVYLQKHAEE